MAKTASRKTGRAAEGGQASDAGAVGRAIMGELMGPEYLARRETLKNPFNEVLQSYSEEVCFGRVWSRKGIDRKQRSIINIAMLVALNRVNQLRNHLDGALNNGCSVEEIQEILLQSAVYCGLPAATDAFRVAEEVLKARKLLD
jgi:4-carboxymuconolactone decarboxylase